MNLIDFDPFDMLDADPKPKFFNIISRPYIPDGKVLMLTTPQIEKFDKAYSLFERMYHASM